jgi:hypothetical protein
MTRLRGRGKPSCAWAFMAPRRDSHIVEALHEPYAQQVVDPRNLRRQAGRRAEGAPGHQPGAAPRATGNTCPQIQRALQGRGEFLPPRQGGTAEGRGVSQGVGPRGRPRPGLRCVRPCGAMGGGLWSNSPGFKAPKRDSRIVAASHEPAGGRPTPLAASRAMVLPAHQRRVDRPVGPAHARRFKVSRRDARIVAASHEPGPVAANARLPLCSDTTLGLAMTRGIR